MYSTLLTSVCMDVSTTRQENLARLISENGTIERLAMLADISPSYISQLKNGHRGMGHGTARNLEKALGLSPGWMDRQHDAQESTGGSAPPEVILFRKLSREQREALTIVLESMVAASK